MKRTIALAVSTILLAGLAGADVVYREIFPNDNGADAPFAETGWQVHVGDHGAPLSTQTVRLSGNTGAPKNLEPVQSAPANAELARGFLFDQDIGRSQLLWTDECDVGMSAGQDIGISWYQSSDASDPVHLAVRMDGVWYASVQTFSQGSAYKQMVAHIATANWLKLDFIENGTLARGTAATPIGVKLEAVGFFIPKLTGKMRIDTVEIQTGAEAATATGPEALLNGFVHPPVIYSPGEKYGSNARNYQGIPGIERAPGGRLWATWYAGTVWEDQYNYVLAATSADDGKTWSDIQFVIDPDGDGPKRAADPCLWLDPNGKLWLFWWMNGDNLSVTMAMTTENPDAEHPVWTKPAPLFSGVMLNKPIVTSQGEWLMPSAMWHRDGSCRVMASTDHGETWELRGTANIPKARRNCDEEMIVERKDGSLWMLVRTADYGIGESVSTDGGKTWTEIKDYQKHATSRFTLLKLKSGNLLLIRNGPVDERIGREKMSAYLSDDDGATWKGGLLLDERNSVSYPDATQSPDGTIYAIYDWERGRDKNILMSTFREKDILAKAFVSPAGRSKVLINKASGINPRIQAAEKAATAAASPRKNENRVPLLVGSQAVLEPLSGELRSVEPSKPIFNNRAYAFSDELPESLMGKRFLFGAMEKTEAVCTSAGAIYVLTPDPDRNSDSVAGTLEKQGFEKTSIPEFALFLMPGGKRSLSNSCCVYQKEVKEGETVEFGKWGILLF
ncbi:MAG: exo-alpha-sialidase [Kiritimatiellales bacterium]|nr:exo-alpha-sialidase [Kiritimatiellales bacterium]